MSNKGGRVSPDYLADIAPEYAIDSNQGFDVLFWIVLRNAYDEAFIYFGYVPVGRNSVFDVSDVEIVVFYLAFFDQVVCYACDVVAVVDVCQFVYFGETLFSKGVYYDSISVLCGSSDVFHECTDIE